MTFESALFLLACIAALLLVALTKIPAVKGSDYLVSRRRIVDGPQPLYSEDVSREDAVKMAELDPVHFSIMRNL